MKRTVERVDDAIAPSTGVYHVFLSAAHSRFWSRLRVKNPCGLGNERSCCAFGLLHWVVHRNLPSRRGAAPSGARGRNPQHAGGGAPTGRPRGGQPRREIHGRRFSGSTPSDEPWGLRGRFSCLGRLALLTGVLGGELANRRPVKSLAMLCQQCQEPVVQQASERHGNP
jgi:hypothetical protein